jgi:hypothetical protein
MIINRMMSIIFASLMLISAAVVTINPMQLAKAQSTDTTAMSNATSATSNVNVSGTGSVSASPPTRAAESSVPEPLSAERLKELEAQLNETLLVPQQLIRSAGPAEEIKPPEPNTASQVLAEPATLDVNASNIANINNMSSTGNSSSTNNTNNTNNTAISQNISQQAIQAAAPISLYKSTIVAPVDPRSIVDEPSVANNGQIVFYTANWYAARSIDFGATWKFINPFTMSDFCCDQDVIYDKNHGIFLWYRQGIENSATGENRFLLGVSKDASTWVFYSITPTVFNSSWKNVWFDYPHITLSNNNLWITSNMFNQAGQFVRTVISSWNLSELSAGTTVHFQYFFETQEFNFTPVQGATNTMYWAVHHSNAQMKLYKWPETSSSISTSLVNIPAWNYGNRGTMICTTPNQFNWCARSDSRITGGWISNGVIGFLWNAKQGSGFPYPYVNVVTFREAGLTFLSNPKLWNPNLAFMFGYASPNNVPGELGIVAIYGSGQYYPSITAGIVDSSSGAPPPYNLVTIRSGNNAASSYGDYIRDRPINGVGRIWIGSGYTLQGCSTGSCVEPRFYAFGR